jgi:hypothetical protein
MHMLSSARDSASPATQRQRQKTADQKTFFTAALQITAAPHDGPVALSAHGGLGSGKRTSASTTTWRPRRRMDEALHVDSWHGGLAWRTMRSSQKHRQEARALHNLRQPCNAATVPLKAEMASSWRLRRQRRPAPSVDVNCHGGWRTRRPRACQRCLALRATAARGEA